MRFLFLILFLAGCHEELNLRIDTNCTEEQRADIISAVNEWNDAWYGCRDDDGIKIVGDVEVKRYDRVDDDVTRDRFDDDDWVVCVPPGSSIVKRYPSDVTAMSTYSANVIIFTERIDREFFRRKVLHELGHYIGLDHTDDDEDVMCGGKEFRSETLSDGDISAMCRMD